MLKQRIKQQSDSQALDIEWNITHKIVQSAYGLPICVD